MNSECIKDSFRGFEKYLNACNKVTQALTMYTCSICDLCAGIEIAVLSQSRQIETSLTSKFEQLSLSTEAQFQTLSDHISQHLNKFTEGANGISPGN